MMIRAICGGLIVLGASGATQAAEIIVRIEGVTSLVNDSVGFFGPAGTVAGNMPFEAIITYDDNRGREVTASSLRGGSGSYGGFPVPSFLRGTSPAVSYQVRIGAFSYAQDDLTFGGLTLENRPLAGQGIATAVAYYQSEIPSTYSTGVQAVIFAEELTPHIYTPQIITGTQPSGVTFMVRDSVTGVLVADVQLADLTTSMGINASGFRSFYDVITESVTAVVNSGNLFDGTPIGPGQIGAQFRPRFGLSMDEAARLGGYDHFNWYQTITSVTSPIGGEALSEYFFERGIGPDPLPGGNPGQRHECGGGPGADEALWYWDEVAIGCAERTAYHVDVYSAGFGLTFFDAVNLCYPGASIEFDTRLVGVRSDGTGDVFNLPGTGFKWSYTQVTPCTAITDGSGLIDDITLQNVDRERGGFGTVELLGSDPIPEPSTWMLLMSGFAMVGVASRAKYRIRRTPGFGTHKF